MIKMKPENLEEVVDKPATAGQGGSAAASARDEDNEPSYPFGMDRVPKFQYLSDLARNVMKISLKFQCK